LTRRSVGAALQRRMALAVIAAIAVNPGVTIAGGTSCGGAPGGLWGSLVMRAIRQVRPRTSMGNRRPDSATGGWSDGG